MLLKDLAIPENIGMVVKCGHAVFLLRPSSAAAWIHSQSFLIQFQLDDTAFVINQTDASVLHGNRSSGKSNVSSVRSYLSACDQGAVEAAQ